MKRNIFEISDRIVSVAPSLLSADFANLASEVARIEAAGADLLHLDIMDGHFVPNITMGPMIIKAIRPHTTLFFDAHLMISNPLKYAVEYVKAGADLITFHIETEPDPRRTISELRKLNCNVGASLKPGTKVEAVLPYLEMLDLLLVMSVEPGFGGQSFMPEVLTKAERIFEEKKRRRLKLHIEIDGGIDGTTAHAASAAGVNMMVAGTAVFQAPDGPEAAMKRIRTAKLRS